MVYGGSTEYCVGARDRAQAYRRDERRAESMEGDVVGLEGTKEG